MLPSENVRWPHFSWATLYNEAVCPAQKSENKTFMLP